MTAAAKRDGVHACVDCLRRGWLLGELGAVLDRLSGDRGRLLQALALDDEQLLAALGGRRRSELEARMASIDRECLRPPRGIDAVCRHDRSRPSALADPGAPRVLFHDGGSGRLAQLTAGPVVSILAPRRCSDYGSEVARSLARGLAAAGVTVASRRAGTLAAAVHAGAGEARGASIAVARSGLPGAQATETGGVCTVTELPCGCGARRWGAVAEERVLAALCTVLLVVEARAEAGELAAAELARSHGRTLAAVPGRITSPLARGPHALLRGGATLIAGAEDVLELLHLQAGSPLCAPSGARGAALPQRLLVVLDRVCCGAESADQLCSEASDPGEVLLALSELELMGLLVRGDGGRYLPRGPH